MTRSPVVLDVVLTIGVTGHRTLAHEDDVRRDCRLVIAETTEAARRAAARAGRSLQFRAGRIRVVSPLAEGADRIVAEEALALGAELQCPFPLFREDYARDFSTDGSRAAFERLCEQSQVVFELDGDPQRREAAYARVGAVVVEQADLLIAVWDGRPSRGVGGTAEIVDLALTRGGVVVLVDPEGARPPELISGSSLRLDRAPLSALPDRLRPLLEPPWDTGRAGFGLLSGLLDDRLPERNSNRPAGVGVAGEEGRPSKSAWFELFERIDGLATRYAGLYRRTYTANFVLSAVAVTAALLGGAEEVKTALPILLETACIAGVIGLTWAARNGAWHERWIEYREAAELLRPLRLLGALGLAPSRRTDSGAGPINDGGPSTLDWLAGRAHRAVGLPQARLEAPYLAEIHKQALAELDGQQLYHEHSAKRLSQVERQSQALGLLLFCVTGLVCILHGLELMGADLPGWLALKLESTSTVLSGALPAFGAAMLGIRNVGEFSRLARRSLSMSSALERLRARLEPPQAGLNSAELGAMVGELAATLTAETVNWRALVITREIELPG